MIGILLVAGGVGLIGLITFVIHKLTTNRAQYFEDRNLKYTGLWPALKSLYRLLFRRVTVTELVKEMYERYPDEA